jgi:hypothetical protein
MASLRRWLQRRRSAVAGEGVARATREASPARPTSARAPDEAGREAVRRAERLAAVGRWYDAVVGLQAHLEVHPRDARAHRELARQAERLHAWNGSFEEAPDPGAVGPFRRLTERHVDGVLGADPLGVARTAMERAVELNADDIAWWLPLGELQAAQGDLATAIPRLQEAVDAAATATSAWVLRTKHRGEFALERARHGDARARVTDPLFDVEVTLVEPVEVPARPVGLCHTRVTHQGLVVGGLVVDGEVETVEVVLDGLVVRTANVPRDAALPAFELLFQRATLDRFPAVSRLEVRTSDGRSLVADGRASAVRLVVPHGDGQLLALLAAGSTIDKKGAMAPTVAEQRALQDRHLELYREVAGWFEVHAGTPLFALYGTLLGIHRDGDLIPGDDDMDVAYVSRADDAAAVKQEACELILALVRAGYTVSLNPRGRLFRVHREGLGPPGLHLDVHPVWFEGDHLYVPNHVTMPAEVTDFLPPDAVEVRGVTVRTPRRPEVFLAGHYGPGWRVPDPAYLEDSTGVPEEVLARFRAALVTPDELRTLQTRLAGDPRPGQGRLVPLATQPLYPVDQLLG